MDPEEIARLVEKIKLGKLAGDQQIILEKDTVKRETKRVNLCLVAKVFSNKPTSRDLFRQHMPQILHLSRSADIELVGDNLFILDFKSAADRRRVLTEGPWNLFRNLVLFQEVKGLQNPREIKFDSINIWVQFHNLPLAFMNKTILASIAGKVGQVLEIDRGDEENFWGKFARARIKMSLLEPLKQFVSVKVDGEQEEVIVLVTYERLPDYCYKCRHIGHVQKDCESRETSSENPLYGSWLKDGSHSNSKKVKDDRKGNIHQTPSGSSTSHKGKERIFVEKRLEFEEEEESGMEKDKSLQEQVEETPGHRKSVHFPNLDSLARIIVEAKKCSNLYMIEEFQNVTPINSYMAKPGKDGEINELLLIEEGQGTEENMDLHSIPCESINSDGFKSTARSPSKWKVRARIGQKKKGIMNEPGGPIERKRKKCTDGPTN